MKTTFFLAAAVGLAAGAQAQLNGSADLTPTPMAGGMTHYAGVVQNTGTTTVGTFWFAWLPGYDFMPHAPVNITAPPGWFGYAQGGGPDDGYSVLWYAMTPSAYIAPNADLSGFGFDSPDAAAVMTGNSPVFPRPFITATSVLYIGSPELDPGHQFVANIRAGAAPCYANCDGSTASPVLNVADFSCFLQKYAAGDDYANCDGSTAAPTLNVQDFSCFLQKYSAGCQ
jgi:hypothetical protein